MKLLKTICGFGLLLVLASNIWTISRWSESRGVYDDVCYLRQAHLFQEFGLDGLNTDIARDGDHYLANKLKEINFPGWNDVAKIPCHTPIPAANKYVLQYPPGTGFALAMFPSGFQVIPLYALTITTIFGFSLLGLFRARRFAPLAFAALYGLTANYLVTNLTKASYSMAPTTIICPLVGFLTARLFMETPRHRLGLTLTIGLLIGASVNFRLANLLLSAGYCLYFAGAFLRARSKDTFLQAVCFGVALLIGMLPTLIANAINAGNPFATTYGGVDAVPPELNAGVLLKYFTDVQSALLAFAVAWTLWLWRFGGPGAQRIVLVIALNLAVNLIFFMSHPIFTTYYIVPITGLSLWTQLFATLDLRGEVASDNRAFPEAATA